VPDHSLFFPEPVLPAAPPAAEPEKVENTGTDEVITPMEVPLAAPVLPKTGGIPLGLLVGLALFLQVAVYS